LDTEFQAEVTSCYKMIQQVIDILAKTKRTIGGDYYVGSKRLKAICDELQAKCSNVQVHQHLNVDVPNTNAIFETIGEDGVFI
jgi:hypothetical protein